MDLAEALRTRDLRLTRPRQLVWDVLTSGEHHLTAADIAAEVHRRDASVNLSSVYRALSLFADLRLARESRLGSPEGSHWEAAHADDVIHLVCEGCSTVQHHHGDQIGHLRSHLGTDHGFEATWFDVVVHGRCDACT